MTTNHSLPQPLLPFGDVDSLRLVKDVKRRLTNFTAAESYFRDPRLQSVAERLWRGETDGDQAGLLGDLWIEGAFPPAVSLSLSDAAARGWIVEDFVEHLDKPAAITSETSDWSGEQGPPFPADRPLFKHQAEVLELAAADPDRPPAIVVTAGTGWGKTEAFLLPALNRLWTRPRCGGGMRCLVLYPLNALVRDQIDRLSHWLEGQTKLRHFQFTSETPEDQRAAAGVGLKTPSGPRVWTRKDARRGPCPDVCVTNYSMLEYMLARPQDEVFFDEALEVVVLDEVHLYTGSLATEITYLLRRTLLRCGVDPTNVLFIAASATAGSDGDRQSLTTFMSDLTGKPAELAHVVSSEFAPLPSVASALTGEVAPREVITFLEDEASQGPSAGDEHQFDDSHVNADSEWRRGAGLFNTVSTWAPMDRLRQHLYERAKSRQPLLLDELARVCWADAGPESEEGVVALLRLGAAARDPDGQPYVPHRLHLVVRGGPNLTLCSNQSCSGPQHLRVEGYGILQEHEGDTCRSCDALMFPLLRCRECGHAVVGARNEPGRISPVLPANLPASHAALATQFQLFQTEPTGSEIKFDPMTGKLGGTARLWQAACRPDDAAGCDHSQMATAATGPGLVFSMLAETMLAAMPPGPTAGHVRLPADGRRILTFSDSRREAARLGPALTWQHAVQMIRAQLLSLIKTDDGSDAETVRYLTERIEDLERRLREADGDRLQRAIRRDLADAQRSLAEAQSGLTIDEWVERLRETPLPEQLLDYQLAKSHRGELWDAATWSGNRKANDPQVAALVGREFLTPLAQFRFRNLETLGLVRVEYPALQDVEIPEELGAWLPSSVADVIRAEWPDVLACLLDSLRQDDAATLGSDDLDREFSERARPIGRHFVLDGQSDRETVPLIGTERQARNRFAAQLLTASRGDDLAVRRLLKSAFDALYELAGHVGWLQRSTIHRRVQIVIPRLVIRRVSDEDQLWRDAAERLSHRAVGGSFVRSQGLVTSVAAEALDGESHYGRIRTELVEEPSLRSTLWAEEHSAQLSPKEARRIQELFTIGARNVLSSSTTLELGVDIGGLSGVLLTNIPPNVARYRQRAGRAGRRGHGASVTVTYARNRPFDNEVFKDTGVFLKKPIRTPKVLMDRKQLALRHAHALLLGEYFRSVRPSGTVTGTMNAYTRMGPFAGVQQSRFWGSGAPPELAAPTSPPVHPRASDLPWWGSNDDKPHADRFIQFLEWLRDQPVSHVRGLAERLLDGSGSLPDQGSWVTFCERVLTRFSEAVSRFRDRHDPYVDAWKMARDESNKAMCNYIHWQLNDLYTTNVVGYLAKHQFLPKYGFPVDVLSLKVHSRENGGANERVSLQRSGALALREYVPGSQVIAAGDEIRSRGLSKWWANPRPEDVVGRRRRLHQCGNGHSYATEAIGSGRDECPFCGGPQEGVPLDVVEVRTGFATANWEPTRRAKADELVGDIDMEPPTLSEHRVGATDQITDYRYAGADGLQAGFWPGISLYTYHRGENSLGFAICLYCGFAESELEPHGEGLVGVPGRFEDHSVLWVGRNSTVCAGVRNSQVVRHSGLFVEDITDGFLLDFGGLVQTEPNDPAIQAIALAAPHAAAEVLNVEPNEVAGIVYPARNRAPLFVYDAVSGAAGHCEALASSAFSRLWLEAIRRRLWVDEDHDLRCERGCMACVVTFEAQHRIANVRVDRRRGLAVMDNVLGYAGPPPPPYHKEQDAPAPEPDPDNVRLARAAHRRNRMRG